MSLSVVFFCELKDLVWKMPRMHLVDPIARHSAGQKSNKNVITPRIILGHLQLLGSAKRVGPLESGQHRNVARTDI